RPWRDSTGPAAPIGGAVCGYGVDLGGGASASEAADPGDRSPLLRPTVAVGDRRSVGLFQRDRQYPLAPRPRDARPPPPLARRTVMKTLEDRLTQAGDDLRHTADRMPPTQAPKPQPLRSALAFVTGAAAVLLLVAVPAIYTTPDVPSE